MSLHDLSAARLAAAVKDDEITPTALVEHYVSRIKALDPRLNAFVTVTEDLAFEQAEEAESELRSAREEGRALPPLFGVPVALKDVVRVESVECTEGSLTRRGEVADIDDHVVTKFKQAGMPILGKTNTPEFALPCYTENKLAAPTRNPWDTRLTPGGSSGGSAVAVAAGMAPLAHGTDAGGSVRIPASACGLVGLKPSRGRVSKGPISHDPTGIDTHGVLARTVEDAMMTLEAMSGLMPGDTSTAPLWPEADPDARCRVAVMAEPMLPGAALHDECRAAVERAAALLGKLGHSVDEMDMSKDQDVADAFQRVWSVVAARIEVEDDDEALLTPFTRYMRETGRGVSATTFHADLCTFAGVGQMMRDMVFASFDVILTPTLAQPPAPIGSFWSDPERDFAAMGRFMPYTPLANMTGLPSVSLPLHWNDDGVPIGVMLTAGYGEERLLALLGSELESMAAASDRHPDVW
ncbi:amidase [Glycomyces arizonensis]|uniref:amidase n=1 Tax=Glycomyces arizonensis TaxID=256035 RepID=UPI00042881FC|nr:amidase [Glycomyces arizonensis]